MMFAFSPEQRALANAVAELLAKRCSLEHVRAVEADPGPRSDELWRALASIGVVGLLAPESAGGLGMDEVDAVLVLEETGVAALPDPLVETMIVGIPMLGAHPAVAAIARGDARLAVGLDTFALDADVADFVLLSHDGALHLLEDPDARRVRSIDGTRRLFEVTPSAGTIISTDIEQARDRAAFGSAAQLLGVAHRLIEMAAAYAQQRAQFGKPIGGFQAVKHHLVNALLKLEFARPVVYNAAFSLAHDVPTRSRDCSMAKAFASEAASISAKTALQVHGAIGYTQESDLHLLLKRAWALSAAYGDAAHHRSRIGTSILQR